MTQKEQAELIRAHFKALDFQAKTWVNDRVSGIMLNEYGIKVDPKMRYTWVSGRRAGGRHLTHWINAYGTALIEQKERQRKALQTVAQLAEA